LGAPSRQRAALLLAYALALSVLVVVFLAGASYYLAPAAERAHHPGYWDYKPSGRVGLPLGLAGATLMVLMLLYSVRKRVGGLRRLGPLSSWLDAHIFAGVIGPLCILLHSSFRVGGLVALSFWSMVAVALSGVLGRYLYLLIPRTRAGDALSLQQLEELDRRLSERLGRDFRLDAEQLQRLERLASPPAGEGLTRTLLTLVLSDLRLRRELRSFARACRGVPPGLVRSFEEVVRDKAIAHRRLLLWDRLHELFHYWHVVHKPFAVVMYLFLVAHVAVAVWTGYGWVGL